MYIRLGVHTFAADCSSEGRVRRSRRSGNHTGREGILQDLMTQLGTHNEHCEGPPEEPAPGPVAYITPKHTHRARVCERDVRAAASVCERDR